MIKRICLLAALALALGTPATPAFAWSTLDDMCTGGSVGGSITWSTGQGVDWSDAYEDEFGPSPQQSVSASMSFRCRLNHWVPGDGLLFTASIYSPVEDSALVSRSCGMLGVIEVGNPVSQFSTPGGPGNPPHQIFSGANEGIECVFLLSYDDVNGQGFLAAGHTYELYFTPKLRYDWEVEPEPVLVGSGSKVISADLHPRSTAANHRTSSHVRAICYEAAPLVLSSFC